MSIIRTFNPTNAHSIQLFSLTFNLTLTLFRPSPYPFVCMCRARVNVPCIQVDSNFMATARYTIYLQFTPTGCESVEYNCHSLHETLAFSFQQPALDGFFLLCLHFVCYFISQFISYSFCCDNCHLNKVDFPP